MGQKTNPIGNRLGFIRGWDSNWYGGNDYKDKLVEDERIREYYRHYDNPVRRAHSSTYPSNHHSLELCSDPQKFHTVPNRMTPRDFDIPTDAHDRDMLLILP